METKKLTVNEMAAKLRKEGKLAKVSLPGMVQISDFEAEIIEATSYEAILGELRTYNNIMAMIAEEL